MNYVSIEIKNSYEIISVFKYANKIKELQVEFKKRNKQ